MSIFRNRVMPFSLLTIIAITLLSACANTKLTGVWHDPDNHKSYHKILVIGIGNSEQNRRLYETHLVKELKTIGVTAIPSYKLLQDANKIDRKSVTKAIQGKNIDAVLVTHLLAVDEEEVYRPSMNYAPVYSNGYYGGLYSYYPYVNSYIHSPGYFTTHKTVTLETNLYDAKTAKLVWSAHSRTFSPESVDEIIVDLTKLVIHKLVEQGVIVKK